MVLKKGNRKGTRNPELVPGVRRYSRTSLNQKKQLFKKAKLGAKGKQIAAKPKTVTLHRERRFYPADDEKHPIRRHRTNKPTKLRKSITPGTIVIILAGRFRGKRVIVLKQLQPSGLLLVTGPYKINGVPLRRVNQAYVIATSTRLDVSKVDVKNVTDAFFAKERKTKKDGAKKSADEFFAKDEKKKVVTSARKTAQKSVDAALAPLIKSVPNLNHYLNAKFSLTKGQYPHQLKF
jgi:large subunit ribosomal protein L6e